MKGKPISVILVTLAAKAYDEMVTQEAHKYSSAIEVALELVERMPKFIQRSMTGVRVDNPALGGARGENFADKWNSDNGLRSRESQTWHGQLMTDLEALFSEEYSKRSENRVQNVFGQHGVNAWKTSVQSPALQGRTGDSIARTAEGPAGRSALNWVSRLPGGRPRTRPSTSLPMPFRAGSTARVPLATRTIQLDLDTSKKSLSGLSAAAVTDRRIGLIP